MNQSVEGSPGVGTPRSRKKTFIIAATVIAVVLVGGIWAFSLPGTAKGNDAGASPSTASPSASATRSAPSTSAAAQPLPDPTTDADSKTAPAAGSPQSDAELAKTPPTVLSPQPFGTVSRVEGKFSAKVSDMTAITAEAKGPGEIAGPAVRFVVTFENGSSQAISLGNAVINVDSSADRIPAIPISGSGTAAFSGTVDAGQSATATYVFLVPDSQRDQVRVSLTFSAAAPIAVFEGAAPRNAP